MSEASFRQMLERAGFVDTRYEASGTFVWLPYGLQVRERFFREVEDAVRRRGYERYEFPLIVPARYMEAQKALKSFEGRVVWVTHYGNEPLEEPYYLRPSGETQVYPMARSWIRSSQDLPLRVLVISPIYRAVKGGTPLLGRQGTIMAEGHAFRRVRADAERELADLRATFRQIMRSLGLAPLVVERPLWGNLPVSRKTFGFDVVTPSGRTIMVVSMYLQDTLYSSLYGIRFEDTDGQKKETSQASWGISSRALGVCLLMHADERGFRLPPALSPVQVVFVPVKGSEEEVALCERLREAVPFRTHVDRSYRRSLRERFSEWECKGVPIRVEVGPNEAKAGEMVLFRRDTNQKTTLPAGPEGIVQAMAEVEAFFAHAAGRPPPVQAAQGREDLRTLAKEGAVVSFPYCGSEACGRSIGEGSAGEILGVDAEDARGGACLACGRETQGIAYFARRL